MTHDTLISKAIATAADLGGGGVHRAGREAELRTLLAQIRAAGLVVPASLTQAEANLPTQTDDGEDIWDNMPV